MSRASHLALPLLAASLTVAALAACASSPIVPLPVPPPPVDLWQAGAGNGTFLGLKTEENDSRSLDALFFEPGVRVVRVVENSPAAAAGVRPGDVVLTADGHELIVPDDLEALVDASAAGDALTLEVQRGDAVFELAVTLTAAGGGVVQTPREPRWLADPSRTRAAWATAADGVALASLADDSPLHEADMAPGDVVVALDGEPVRSARALLRRLTSLPEGARTTFTLRGEGGPREERVRLARAPRRVTGFHIPILVEWKAEPDGSAVKFELIDIWILSLFRYERVESERTWTLLSLFDYSTGVGSLGP